MSHIKDLEKALAHIATRQLRDFGPLGTDLCDLVGFRAFESRLDIVFAPMSELLHLALLSRGAVDQASMEKTLWEVGFSFCSTPCVLRYTKFGISLTILIRDEESESAPVLGERIESRLRSAVKNIQTRIVEPRIEEQRRRNNVTVVNQHGRYAGFVSYFREALGRLLVDAGSSASDGDSSSPPSGGEEDFAISLESILGGLQEKVSRQHEMAYLATALLAGYFSLVQHRLVLLTAFSPAATDADFSVDSLFGLPWAEQFCLAVAGRASRPDEIALADLHYLARTYRNSLLHGGGGRLSDGLYVEWAPGWHSVVTMRGEFADQFMLCQPAVSRDEVEDILSKIDRIEGWFESLPYFPWLASGLPVSFDRPSVELALAQLRNGTVGAYFERREAEFDRDINFEF